MTDSPAEIFYPLFMFLQQHDLPRADVHVTIRIATPEAHAYFLRHWQHDQTERYRELGHKNPETVGFPTEGTLYGIPFKIEGPG